MNGSDLFRPNRFRPARLTCLGQHRRVEASQGAEAGLWPNQFWLKLVFQSFGGSQGWGPRRVGPKRNTKMCTFGLPNVHISGSQRFKNTTNIQREDTQRDGKGKKKGEILGGPAEGGPSEGSPAESKPTITRNNNRTHTTTHTTTHNNTQQHTQHTQHKTTQNNTNKHKQTQTNTNKHKQTQTKQQQLNNNNSTTTTTQQQQHQKIWPKH